MNSNIGLILLFSVLVILAALFSGSETGLYQLSRLRLRVGIEKKRLLFVTLGKCVHDGPGLLLTLLIGNNLMHYLATSVITYFFSRISPEHSAEVLATAVAAPLLFVFSELIPKNVFYYRADFLMPIFAPMLYVFHRILTLCGLVPALKLASDWIGRLAGLASSSKAVVSSSQKHQVRALIQETREEGLLSSVQTDMINRIVGIPNIGLGSVMVPIGKVQMVEVCCDRGTLLSRLQKHAFSRWLVYEKHPDNIIGYINIYEVLCGSESFSDLRDFIKPIRKINAGDSVIDAISLMQKEKQKIILVIRDSHIGSHRPLGIVTMKDLAEEILGELVEW